LRIHISSKPKLWEIVYKRMRLLQETSKSKMLGGEKDLWVRSQKKSLVAFSMLCGKGGGHGKGNREGRSETT